MCVEEIERESVCEGVLCERERVFDGEKEIVYERG